MAELHSDRVLLKAIIRPLNSNSSIPKNSMISTLRMGTGTMSIITGMPKAIIMEATGTRMRLAEETHIRHKIRVTVRIQGEITMTIDAVEAWLLGAEDVPHRSRGNHRWMVA